MNLDELRKKYEEMGEEIERLKRDEDYVLKLRVDYDESLIIYFTEGEKEYILSSITKTGRCYMIDLDCRLNNYELWREHDMKFDGSVIKWRGGKYGLYDSNGEILLGRFYVPLGCIYNFEECESIRNCSDNNIKRFKHNNRPILF